MRKSNWIIAAILLVASLVFLWLWQALEFNLVDNPIDVVVTAVWWVVIIAGCLVIHWARRSGRSVFARCFSLQAWCTTAR